MVRDIIWSLIDNHIHKIYGPLLEKKRLTLGAQTTSVKTISTVRTNVVKGVGSNSEDYIIHNYDNNYVDTIINTISITPNINSPSKFRNSSYNSQ